MIPPGCCTTDQSGLTLLFLPFLRSPVSPSCSCGGQQPLPSSLALRAALPSSATHQSPVLLPWLPTSSCKEPGTGSAPVTKAVLPPGGISWQCWHSHVLFLPTTLRFRVTKIKTDLSLLLQPWLNSKGEQQGRPPVPTSAWSPWIQTSAYRSPWPQGSLSG